MTTRLIKAGYYDWSRFGLRDTFYPEDMPEEWRLAFYANEIECAQINLSEFSSQQAFEELCEDMPDAFSLVVQCDDVAQWPLLHHLLKSYMTNVSAVIYNELCEKEWGDALACYTVPCVLANSKHVFSSNLQINAKYLKAKAINIAYIDEVQNLKQLRAFIDQWIKNQNQETFLLFLNPKVYQSSFSGDIRIMIDMMGL